MRRDSLYWMSCFDCPAAGLERGYIMVKDILFDLDNTLFDFHADERAALKKTFRDLAFPLSDAVRARYSAINESLWKALERGEISRSGVKKRRFYMLFEEFGFSLELADGAAERYLAYLAKDFHFMEGAKELLHVLEKRYRLFLVSNGNLSVQEGRLTKAGIKRYFSGIFISEVLGAEKPDRRFFDLAFAQVADFDPARAVIVGDSLSSDIAGGINAGIRTIWLHPGEDEPQTDIRADYEIKKLKDLPDLLQKL